MFLLRTAFWLSLVVVLLPTPDDENIAATNMVGTTEAISLAQSTVGDLSQFCIRNPETCVTGNQVVSSFGQKARYGAEIVYKYLDEKFGDPEKATLKAVNPKNHS